MRRASFWLAALVCLNLVLLSGVLIFATAPRTALAQSNPAAGTTSNYVVVSGQVQRGQDVLYLLDARERALHAFFFRKGTRDIIWGGMRSLEADFRNNRD